MNKGKKRIYLFYYLLFNIYFIVTLIPFLLIPALIHKFFPSIKWPWALFQWHEDKLEVWYEFITLYKWTGHKYRPEEYRYEIYTDKRDKSLQKKEELIDTDFAFFNDATIIYYEPFNCPAVRRYILKNIKSINASLGVKSQKLFFWPMLRASSKKAFLQNIIYNKPNNKAENCDVLFNFFKDPKWISQLLNDWLESVKIDGPCFLQYSGFTDPKTKKALYRIFHLPYKNKYEIKNAVKYYTFQLWDKSERVSYQLNGKENPRDADEIFEEECLKTSYQITNDIFKLLGNKNERFAMSVIIKLLNRLKDKQPGILELLQPAINELIIESAQDKISRLRISSDYRIFLPDYNLEIELGPLPKTIFLFLLTKPEGVFFKNMRQYHKEILDIYGKISSRTDLKTMQESIDELTNPLSNSISEKCSRIKEAFLRKIHDRYARHYYVTGARGEAKKITLDRTLVEYHDLALL